MIVFSLLTPFMLIEPPDLKKKKLREMQKREQLRASSNDNKKESKCAQGCKDLKKLLVLNRQAYRDNKKLLVAVIY